MNSGCDAAAWPLLRAPGPLFYKEAKTRMAAARTQEPSEKGCQRLTQAMRELL
jgi:hypothetical protein